MKRIELKTIQDKTIGKFDYREQLKLMLARPVEGIGIVEMRKAMKILDAIDASVGQTSLELEDEPYAYLRDKVVGWKSWLIVNQTIIDFVDSIEQAEDPMPTGHK